MSQQIARSYLFKHFPHKTDNRSRDDSEVRNS
uniref:Uncharacterized protein n=1 Tax=Arundo donax TaxID=35708 RepID=A0A0A9BL25_ARUDO